MSNQGESEQKTQLESARGGSGRKGKTAIGAGEGGRGGYPGDTSPCGDWPDEPNLANRPRTVICDRSELIRSGLKAMITPFTSIVGEASDGLTAMEVIRRLSPDLVISDVDLDVLNGLEVCRRTCETMRSVCFLVLTDSYHATKYYHQLSRAGSRGFCLKCSGPAVLFEAINQITRSRRYCDPTIMQLINQAKTRERQNLNLTDCEIEVLIRLDLYNKGIAEELNMKLRTVEKHIECILAKLKVSTRTGAALKAVQIGYVLLPKMPGRDPVTCRSHEQTIAEKYAEEAIRRLSS
jgi:two-component system, NarL family, nitrate/nitrite response regulator NarL